MSEYCITKHPRVRHIRDDMDALCGKSYFLLWRVNIGQKGGSLPLCSKCEKIYLLKSPRPTRRRRGSERLRRKQSHEFAVEIIAEMENYLDLTICQEGHFEKESQMKLRAALARVKKMIAAPAKDGKP